MDGNDRRHPQYGQPYQAPSSSRPLQRQSLAPPSTDRYPHASDAAARSDVPGGSSARPYLPSYPTYGFQDQPYAAAQLPESNPMQGVEMQYAAPYMQDVSRQQPLPAGPSHPQQPQYAHYAPGAMLPPVGQHLYDQLSFQQRQPTVDVLPSQINLPQYLPSGGHTGVGITSTPSQYLSSQSSQTNYPVETVSRSTLGSQAFGVAPPDFPIPDAHEAGASQAPAADDHGALMEGLRRFHRQLQAAFDAILAKKLNAATENLLQASRWLVSSVEHLGLHHDDESKYAERLALFRELNLCWEALGQKQKDMTEEAVQTKRPPGDILSADTLSSLVDDLIGLCDKMEPHGLVDFEMGIWEEQIVHVLTGCLDLLSQNASALQSA